MMAYYNNPRMLAYHYRQWADFCDATKAFMEIVLADDGSQERAVDVPRPAGLPPLRIYRVTEDRLWHQNGARNLAAHHASSDFLFMTDMDHVVPENTLIALRHVASARAFYMFERRDYKTGQLTLDKRGNSKPHPNTFALAREAYWRLGGYDERTCGYYGTDSIFKRKLRANLVERQISGHIYRYCNDDVPDASTRNATRKEGRAIGWRAKLLNEIAADPRSRTMQFEWVQDL